MGKAVPKYIKIWAEELLERFPDKFSDNFEKNKVVIDELGLSFGKFSRNMVAGFIVRKINERKKALASPVVQKPAKPTESS